MKNLNFYHFEIDPLNPCYNHFQTLVCLLSRVTINNISEIVSSWNRDILIEACLQENPLTSSNFVFLFILSEIKLFHTLNVIC